MKIYELTHITFNKRGRIITKVVFPVAFNTELEMNEYMKIKWAMADDNESYIAVEIRK